MLNIRHYAADIALFEAFTPASAHLSAEEKLDEALSFLTALPARAHYW